MIEERPEQPTNQVSNLTLEQKFALVKFEQQVSTINLDQAKELLLDLYRQMISKDNMYKELIAHNWGIK